MKILKNIFVTGGLLIIIVILILHIVSTQKNNLGYMYDNAKREIRNILGIEYKLETSKALESERISVKEELSYKFFEEFNKNHRERVNNGDYEEYDKNLKQLYKEAKTRDEADSFEYKLSGGLESIEANVLSSYLVYNEAELKIPDNVWHGLSKTKAFHDDNGELLEGYAYLVVDIKVTNTSGKDIDMIMTNPGMDIFFLDEGELYYNSLVCLFFSFQPGESEQRAAYYYNFNVGESFTSSYVFAVPIVAFEYFDCCLAVCPAGNGAFPTHLTTMIILESLRTIK